MIEKLILMKIQLQNRSSIYPKLESKYFWGTKSQTVIKTEIITLFSSVNTVRKKVFFYLFISQKKMFIALEWSRGNVDFRGKPGG